MTSAPVSMLAPLTTMALVSAASVALTGQPSSLAIGLVPLLLWRIARDFASRRTVWELLTDRLHLPADGRRTARVVDLRDLTTAGAARDSVRVGGAWGTEVLASSEPARFVEWLQLLRSPLLTNLEAVGTPSVRCRARDEVGGREGFAVLTRQGVLFLPSARRAGVMRLLGVHVETDLKFLFELLVYVLEGRWDSLARALSYSGEGVWLTRQTAQVDLDHHSHITIEGAEPREGTATPSARIQLEFEVNRSDLAVRAHANTLLLESGWRIS